MVLGFRLSACDGFRGFLSLLQYMAYGKIPQGGVTKHVMFIHCECCVFVVEDVGF